MSELLNSIGNIFNPSALNDQIRQAMGWLSSLEKEGQDRGRKVNEALEDKGMHRTASFLTFMNNPDSGLDTLPIGGVGQKSLIKHFRRQVMNDFGSMLKKGSPITSQEGRELIEEQLKSGEKLLRTVSPADRASIGQVSGNYAGLTKTIGEFAKGIESPHRRRGFATVAREDMPKYRGITLHPGTTEELFKKPTGPIISFTKDKQMQVPLSKTAIHEIEHAATLYPKGGAKHYLETARENFISNLNDEQLRLAEDYLSTSLSNEKEIVAEARRLIRSGDTEGLEMLDSAGFRDTIDEIIKTDHKDLPLKALRKVMEKRSPLLSLEDLKVKKSHGKQFIFDLNK